MKNIKKLITLFLLLLITVSVAIPHSAYAANTGEIVIENYDAEQTYTAYKIFDVVYNTTGGNYAYTITSGSPWFDVVKKYSDDSLSMKLTQVNGSTLYTVTYTSDTNSSMDYRAADFAEYLKEKLTAGEVTDTTAKEFESKTLSGLELGYYFVSTTNGTLCNLTTTDPSEVIYDKNINPTITKTYKLENETEYANGERDKLVELGERIDFAISYEFPYVAGYEKFLIFIEDNMSENMTFDRDSLKLFVGKGDDRIPVPLPAVGGGYVEHESLNWNTNGFVVEVDIVDQFRKAGEVFNVKPGQIATFEYSAVVNKEALTDTVLTNRAVVRYSYDPNDPEKITTNPANDQIIKLYSAAINIDKTDASNGEVLENAKFKLYKKDIDGTKMYYAKTDADVTWIASQGNGTYVTTDIDGKAVFAGLGDGTYYLEEVEAPAGYNILENAVKVVVDNSIANDTIKATQTISVTNNSGRLLPSTGGVGTQMLYIFGAILVAGAFILIVTKKRMSAER